MDTLKNEKTKVRPLYISDSLKKFLTILNQYPVIKQYWHIENGNYVVCAVVNANQQLPQ